LIVPLLQVIFFDILPRCSVKIIFLTKKEKLFLGKNIIYHLVGEIEVCTWWNSTLYLVGDIALGEISYKVSIFVVYSDNCFHMASIRIKVNSSNPTAKYEQCLTIAFASIQSWVIDNQTNK
jgi:hypothetical protein